MKFESLMTMPFMDALKLIVGGAVEEYLDRSGLVEAIAEAAKCDGKNESDSLDAEGALAFLNANGYPMKKEKTPQAPAEKQIKPAKRKRVTLSNVDASTSRVFQPKALWRNLNVIQTRSTHSNSR